MINLKKIFLNVFTADILHPVELTLEHCYLAKKLFKVCINVIQRKFVGKKVSP